jgi:hypothetical protein
MEDVRQAPILWWTGDDGDADRVSSLVQKRVGEISV